MNTQTLSPKGHVTTREINELKRILGGKVLTRGDEDYDITRKVWNGMIDRKPAVIVQCLNTVDVIQSVKFARENKLVASVRGGGHNVTGYAVCDEGIMIDLSLMRSVKVNAEKQIAEVQTGATWGDFDKTTQQYGLASTGGLISTTGVAGLTLGGGVGWLVRKHGLCCDNLVSAEIVTADGSLLQVSSTDNPELFWGIRGGGGNFGIVTSMKFRLYKLAQITGGMIVHPQSNARAAIQYYREFMKTAPDELTLYTCLLTSPDGFPVVAHVGCFSGEIQNAEDVLKPLRQFGTPLADQFQPMAYTELQSMLDAPFPKGNRYYWKSGFLKELSDDAIDTIIQNASGVPSPFSAIILEFYGGASAIEPEGGTAYPHRQSEFDLVIISNWTNIEEDEKNITWTRNFFASMEPFLSHKVYMNALGVEGDERIKEAYGDNYEKLVALKNKYDPQNLFCMNQNIKPTF